MEHGAFEDPANSTFSLADEDHTLANSIRFTLNQDPRVTFCGYSIPHPADAKVNIRVQTTGDAASEVLKDASQNLMLMCQHIRSTFEEAVVAYKIANPNVEEDKNFKQKEGQIPKKKERKNPQKKEGKDGNSMEIDN